MRQLEEYINVGTKRMRCGYTTGTCAAAASRAAAELLLSGNLVPAVTVSTPAGIDVVVEIEEHESGDGWAQCAVQKDSGDDPDVTNGALVYARVERCEEPGGHVDGGIGVGRVTREGLDQPVGAAAINSTPRRMIVEQLEFCTTVILNKADLVSEEQLDELRAIVRSLQIEAVIIDAVECDVPLSEVLDTDRFDFDNVYRSAAWLDMMVNPEDHGDPELLEYGISTFVYARRRPFDLDKFADFAANWPKETIRTKGMTWFAQQPDTCFLLEQSGEQRSFIDNGPFVASLPEEDQTRIFEDNPGIMARWDASCGDRQNILVFIGKDMDRAAIESALDACLTDWVH